MCKDLDQLNMFGYLQGLHYRAKGQSIKFTLSACTPLKVPDINYTVKAYHPNIIQSLQHDCDSHLPDDTERNSVLSVFSHLRYMTAPCLTHK